MFVVGVAMLSSRAGAENPKPKFSGCKYPAATSFVKTYCAQCHSAEGADAQHTRAYAVLQLDTYDQWKSSAKVILAVLDKWHLDGRIMPPTNHKAQPTDAERSQIVAWLTRGSPNTPQGK